MQIPFAGLRKLCTPAYIYLVISIFSIHADVNDEKLRRFAGNPEVVKLEELTPTNLEMLFSNSDA